MRKQFSGRFNEINHPTFSTEQAMARNYSLGIVDGIRLAMKMPSKLIELKTEDFKEWLENERSGNTRNDG